MVKQGYMKTEFGVIPEDWDVRTLETLYNITSSKRVFQSQWRKGGIPFYRAREIAVMSEGKPAPEDLYIDVILYDLYTRQYGSIKTDDVLITGVGTLGKVYVVKENDQFYFKDGNIIWLQFKGGSSSQYLKHQYDMPVLINQVFGNAGGSTVATYTITNAKATKVPFPPLDEQKRIAEALSDVDSMIFSFEKLIAKKKAVKQGAMQELLTGKKHLPGFEGERKSILLEDVCVFYNGGTPSKKRSDWWNGCIPWISSSDLCENSITSVSINRYITQDALDHSATRLCPKNAVSIVSRVGVGKVAVTPCELCTSQDFTTIVSSAHNPYFLAYMLVPIMKDMAMQAQGTSIKGVTVEDIAKIKISTPSIKEQNQIVSILSDMDNEIEALEHKLEKTRQIKQGMMQQLLTGKIRLV